LPSASPVSEPAPAMSRGGSPDRASTSPPAPPMEAR
jgi:hypothetical protein